MTPREFAQPIPSPLMARQAHHAGIHARHRGALAMQQHARDAAAATTLSRLF